MYKAFLNLIQYFIVNCLVLVTEVVFNELKRLCFEARIDFENTFGFENRNPLGKSLINCHFFLYLIVTFRRLFQVVFRILSYIRTFLLNIL